MAAQVAAFPRIFIDLLILTLIRGWICMYAKWVLRQFGTILDK